MTEYERIVEGMLSLAAEASIRANGMSDPSQFVWHKALADNVYEAVLTATLESISDDRMMQISFRSDAEAIRRIGGMTA